MRVSELMRFTIAKAIAFIFDCDGAPRDSEEREGYVVCKRLSGTGVMTLTVVSLMNNLS